MPISFSVSDNQDGTGGVATIAGSAGGDTNTVFRSAWTGEVGSLSFTSTGSRSGDGTVTLSVSNGLWIWLLESVSGGTKTNVLYYRPTSGGVETSVMSRILTQVRTQIAALSLTGISSSNIVVKWTARAFDGTTDPTPRIVICPAPLPETVPVYTTATDHVGYPVLVTMIDAQNQDYDENIARNTLWREKIAREFRYQRLAGINEVGYCYPEPKAILDPGWFTKNYYHSAFVLRFMSRETRGN